MIDHISISQINTFSMCELQYYFSYIMGLKVPPKAAMTVGTATHKGVEHIYSNIMETGNYLCSNAQDIARDYIVTDPEETDWEAISPSTLNEIRGTAIDRSVNMVKAYDKAGYADSVRQEEILGVEAKADVTFRSDGCNTPPHIIGFADLVLADKVIDFKTGSRKVSVPTGQHYLQNGFYAMAFDKKSSAIHNMSCNEKGTSAQANDFDVPMIEHSVLREIIQVFWNKIKNTEQSGNWMPTGMTHQWACSYCGYGRIGKCPFMMKS
jgi:CRISPR/Cas system-associated exonuclease Cas4 (RecB family)